MNGNGNDMDLYRAAGELAGITSLVDAFYSNMDTFPEARVIRNMHPEDLTESRKKLIYFLCGVLGGPRLYIEHYGGVNLPDFHRQFPIGTGGRKQRGRESFFVTVRVKNLRGPSGFLDTRFEQPPATIQNALISTPQESLH